jgi:hypothetical protein
LVENWKSSAEPLDIMKPNLVQIVLAATLGWGNLKIKQFNQ